MAKTSIIHRQKKRARRVAVCAERRAELIKVIKDPGASLEEKAEAYRALHRMGRDASPSRLVNRCVLTGRSRGYYRRFGISRHMVRKLAHKGELPGVRKSSW